VSNIQYYECPNCHKESLCAKKNRWFCLDCKETFDFRKFSRQQMHTKKYIETPDFVSPDKDLVKKKPIVVHKSKQHCEHITQHALRSIPNIWYSKLQVNPNAHTPTVGDYLVLTSEYNFVFECKELNTTKNDIFPFSRFTQIGNMTAFEKSLKRNKAFFIVLLWSDTNYRGLKSTPHALYVIPLKSIQEYILASNKKSMNTKEIETFFSSYRVNFDNLEIHLKKLFSE